ncbi:hypothetical protein [Cardiobacterium hominis]|uniref:hypothetical protein n=1 Tax=Cardiobacterium hominis TaxID=2718 RepID=UPI0028E7090E|nr:hypothetical protein [Cardiobacterium hominis]
MPKEIHNAIIVGLIKLVTLRLRGAPPAESVTTVAEVWLETLARRDWQPADVARIECAFRRLCAEMTDWPAPRHFLDRLPPRPSLPPPDTIHDPVEAAKNADIFDQIAQMLKMENAHEHRTETEQKNRRSSRQPDRDAGRYLNGAK